MEQQGQAQDLWPSLPAPGPHGTLWVSRRQPNVSKAARVPAPEYSSLV